MVYEPPEVMEKRFVGSRVRWPDFGPILATMAWTLGFLRRDAQGVSRRRFGEQLDDLAQPLLVVRADLGFHPRVVVTCSQRRWPGATFAEGWPIYEQWIAGSGKAKSPRSSPPWRSGNWNWALPQEEDGETSPRQIVAQALTYLQNHQSQMSYAEYRQQGLPITSSYVESAVKQFNQRVKGTEKFWTEAGRRSDPATACRPFERRSTARRILANPASQANRTTPLPQGRVTTNRVVHPVAK